MTRNESTRELKQFPVRPLMKALRAAGTASLAVLAGMQSMSWVFATLRTRMLATVTLASMSAWWRRKRLRAALPFRPQ